MDKEKGSQSTAEEHSVGDAPPKEADRPSGKDHRSSDVSSDHADSLSGEDHRSGDIPSKDVNTPARKDFGETSGATERASVVRNDTSGLTIELFERDIPITLRISSEVAARAALAGLSVEAGDKIRVPILENMEKVDSIFRDK